MVRTASPGPKRWLMDHDTFVTAEAPPTVNIWYENFHELDVRLLFCIVMQENTGTTAEDLEIRWTIDGNVYFVDFSATNLALYYIRRDYNPSTVGTLGLQQEVVTAPRNAAIWVDKRGLDFQVEVRQTSGVGAGSILHMWSVLETLEVT